MTAERLLDRLQGVREKGPGRWTASCSGPLHKHDDRNPSLSIRETSDGTVLIHCFSGCGAADIVSAVGLEFSDLYPERLDQERGPQRPNHYHAAREALRVLDHEALIVAVAAENIATGITLSDEDRDRLMLAVQRIRDAMEATQ